MFDILVGLALSCTVFLVSLGCITDVYKLFSESVLSIKERGDMILLDQTVRLDIERGDGSFEAGENYFAIGDVRYEFDGGQITRIEGDNKRVVGQSGYSFEVFNLDGEQFVKIVKTGRERTEIAYRTAFVLKR